jgi:hypothetical protein
MNQAACSSLAREATLSQSHWYDPKRVTGYRLEQLAAAFDRVRHPHDWKAPIRAVIPAQERVLIAMAGLWFTETVPEFEPVSGETDRLVVVAPGYRQGPAGDPSDAARSRFNRSSGRHDEPSLSPWTGR